MTKRLREDDAMLLWRLEPHKRFSDWKIKISISGEDDPPETYHVHKVHLAVGSYFYGLFISEMKEAQNNTTHLSLQKSAAEAFPVFLDYICNGGLDVNAENAVALRHLGDYFGVKPLKELASAFIEKDSTVKNQCHYCKEALSYGDTAILDSSLKRIAHMAPDDLLSLREADDSKSHPVHDLMSLLSAEQWKQLYVHALEKARADNACVRIPHKIVVKDAGHDAVNGVYSAFCKNGGDINFRRNAEYNGETVRFSIFKAEDTRGVLGWWLSIKCKDTGTNSNINFYSVRVSDDCLDLPPIRGWCRRREGMDPLPKFEYLYRTR